MIIYDMPEELVTFITPGQFSFYAHEQPSAGEIDRWRMIVKNESDEGKGLWTARYNTLVATGQPIWVSASMRVKVLDEGRATMLALWYAEGNFMSDQTVEITGIGGNRDYGQSFDKKLIAPPGATELRLDFRLWNARGKAEFWGCTIWPGVPINSEQQ